VLERGHVEGIGRIYAWHEPDSGGDAFVPKVAERLSAIGWTGELLVVEGPDGAKDPNDLHRRDPAAFAEQMKAALESASFLDSRLQTQSQRENREKREKPVFVLTRLDALLGEPEEDVEYVVADMLPTGGLSLMCAKPKVGKSTTARYLALCVARGEPFLDRATKKGPVVYLALEEKRSEVARHFRRMGAGDDTIYVHTGAAPEEALEALRAAVEEHQPVLAVVDPILKLIRLRDGNDYAEVSRAFEPLIELARHSGCHLVCPHHLGKGDRTGGDQVLGSTALFGAVDTLILMRRHDQTRTIETIQRYGEDMPETVVKLDPETGCVSPAGTVAELQLEEAEAAVLAAIGDEPLTEADVRERVGGNRKLAAEAIRSLVAAGKLTRTGEGKRGSPYLYGRAGSDPPGESSILDSGPRVSEKSEQIEEQPEPWDEEEAERMRCVFSSWRDEQRVWERPDCDEAIAAWEWDTAYDAQDMAALREAHTRCLDLSPVIGLLDDVADPTEREGEEVPF
jgi:hypothetical protein